jgi:hypothetical protein
MMRTLLLLALIAPASAQWLKHPTAGIPRNADGTPNLTAPAPKTADGKPDFSGIWRQPNGVKYTVNIAADMKPEDVPMLPATAAEYKRRQDTLSKDDPIGFCNLPGVPQVTVVPYPYKILQNSTQITFLYEAIRGFREIFIDGRSLPADMQPSWLGYSIGHWEDDTLVVLTAGQNDKTWLDSGGHPHSEQLRVIEKYRRRTFGTIDLETNIDDPGAYSKPWTVKYELRYVPDTELLEYVCTENNKDPEHLVGK